jgi:23S rRNA pseudouridine1911/1915/1917 synthase
MFKPVLHIVDETTANERLDVFLASNMPRLSRAFIQKLCATGKIEVNGEPGKSGQKLHEGDMVTVDYDETELDKIPHIDIPILYEDDDCLVLNKPAGVLTHSQGSWTPEATVASFLRDKLKGLEGERAGVVHRLDRATSGVMICAKNQTALSWLQKQFAQHKVKKTYIALVKGHPKSTEAMVDMPIERNPKAPATFRVGVNGKPAVTRYKVLEKGPHAALLELQPETGRTHQLRVHLNQLGHPIIGDPLYGDGAHGDRLFLHALTLEITLPSLDRKLFKAALPREFRRKLAK